MSWLYYSEALRYMCPTFVLCAPGNQVSIQVLIYTPATDTLYVQLACVLLEYEILIIPLNYGAFTKKREIIGQVQKETAWYLKEFDNFVVVRSLAGGNNAMPALSKYEN